MDGNLAATYTLIHAFLTKRSHAKVAFALKKAVKDVVILKDNVDIEGPQLDEIVKQWKALDKKNVDSSDSDESSSDSGSSSAYSSDSDTSKQSPPKAISKGSSSWSSSSDSSSSSSDTDDSGTTKKKGNRQIPTKAENRPTISVTGKSKKITPDRSSMTLGSSDISDSDDSNNNEKEPTRNPQRTDSSDTSSSESEGVNMKAVAEKSNKKVSISSSSNPSSSESEEELVVKMKGKSKKVVAVPQSKKVTPGSSASLGLTADTSSEEETTMKPKTADPTPPPPSAPLSEADSPKPTKKQRTSMSGAAVTIATTGTYEPKSMAGGNGKQGKAPRKTNEPFKRIKPQKRKAEQIEFDNRYEAKTAPVDDYGAKAHQDLIVTRGAGFRKEKNKKKRGSYRGGEITMQSHSFKFTD